MAAGRARPGDHPDGSQRLLNHTRWDPDALRDDVRGDVTEQLGDPGRVLVVDERGFLKKGGESAGVQRRYSGTAGRVENCQVGVLLATPAARVGAGGLGAVAAKAWAGAVDRRAEARVPARVGFQTKPQLARGMPGRAVDAQMPAGGDRR